jgi:hypothetical protein
MPEGGANNRFLLESLEPRILLSADAGLDDGVMAPTASLDVTSVAESADLDALEVDSGVAEVYSPEGRLEDMFDGLRGQDSAESANDEAPAEIAVAAEQAAGVDGLGKEAQMSAEEWGDSVLPEPPLPGGDGRERSPPAREGPPVVTAFDVNGGAVGRSSVWSVSSVFSTDVGGTLSVDDARLFNTSTGVFVPAGSMLPPRRQWRWHRRRR